MTDKIIAETGQRILILSESERKSLSDYQASGGNVNTYLDKKAKGETAHISPDLVARMEEDVKNIDSLFDRSDTLNRPFVVYRGLSVKVPSAEEFRIPCYVGTTYEPGITIDEFAAMSNRTILQEIQLNPGQKAIFIPAYLSFDPFHEKELLLPRDTFFRVLSRDEIDGKIVEKVEVIY